VSVVVVLAVAAIAVASRVRSPAQAAAGAAAPAPSVITAQVTKRVLSNQLVFRGNAVASHATSIGPPTVAGDLPIVTSAAPAAGRRVAVGEVLVAVAGRPVVVLEGVIPAYRTMAPGDSGPDVAELQRGLTVLGYGIGGDRAGTYGYGTEQAVRGLYSRIGFPPVLTSPDADAQLAAARAAVPTDGARATTAAARLAKATAGLSAAVAAGATARVRQRDAATVARDKSALTATASAVTAAAGRVVALEQTTGATVPLGEVAFVPSLPAFVVSSSGSLGQRVGSQPLVTLSSGAPLVQSVLDAQDGILVHAGEVAALDDDSSGAHYAGHVVGIGAAASSSNGGPPTVAVTLEGVRPLPLSEVGANLRVTIETATTSRPVLVVPVAAVFTTANGESQVSLWSRGRSKNVPVTVGLDADGYVEIRPLASGIAAGSEVVVGSRGGGS
jgi:peptidoglycan hydrolase-like protein with peptidoglycan-binding domain